MFKVPNFSKPPIEMEQFSGIMAFINQDDKSKEDIGVLGSNIEFTNRKTLALPTKSGTQEFSFNEWSFAQFAEMLKIPSKYLASCPVNGKGSQRDQIEARMSERLNQNHLIRLRRTHTEDNVFGVVRAVLPGDYSIFDNRHLVTAVKRAITEAGGSFKLELTNVHDPRSIEQSLHMRFLKDQQFDLDISDAKDPHKIGFHCFTSEIGDGDIRLDALVYRLVCKNGMMGFADSEVLRLRHKNFQTHEVTPQIQSGVLASVSLEAPIKDLLERKYNEPVADPETQLLLMGARMKVSDWVRDQAMTVLRAHRKPKYSRFDIMQSFTEAAQTLPFADRIKLEMNTGRSFLGGRRIRETSEDSN